MPRIFERKALLHTGKVRVKIFSNKVTVTGKAQGSKLDRAGGS